MIDRTDLEPGWYRDADYLPVIQLALNFEAGQLTIHDFIYSEEHDLWFVELTDERTGYYDMGFQLSGSFIRTCFKAFRKGKSSWSNRAEKERKTIPLIW